MKVLDFFVNNFSELFYPEFGFQEPVECDHVVFSGPCDVTNQLVVKSYAMDHRGQKLVYQPGDDFIKLFQDVNRNTIDSTKYLVVVYDVEKIPISNIKRLVSCSHVWVVATGRFTPELSGFLRLIRVGTPPGFCTKIIREAERNGVKVQCFPMEYDTIGEFVMYCDGCEIPEVDFKHPAESAHKLLGTGLPPSYICRKILFHQKCVDLCAKCELDMVRCKRSLVMSKILEYYIREIGKVVNKSSRS